MKKLLFLLPLCVAGCSATNLTKLTNALAKDPAIVSAKVTGVYGTAQLTRVGSVTNQTVTVSPDGTITVKPGP